ncbi:aldolase/citrate lyase family protein [Nocardioides baculatus]|uniref:HpcH/HpaI aldolase/citrate lyase domain-containing protein n=1 Tax=Nocardioides baculatus TaxID=2801337 RepID=A0ABS1LA96_9ACTN|nr:aldolase/citrate lyase family protein [Nocardioides baculatus]MBL0748452.1 hypothetical protein [Nocardioides baculatus]
MKDLRQHWAEGRPTHGLWSLLPGAVTAEVLARTGADHVVVDLQHGAVGEADLPGITAAIRAAAAVPLVRTRSSSFPDVGRPLDLGAHGVMSPTSATPSTPARWSTRRGTHPTALARSAGSWAAPTSHW